MKKGVLSLTRMLLFAVLIVTLCCSAFACGDKNVTSIEVDENSNVGFYVLEGFNISTLKLIVYYEDGSHGRIAAENSMLTTEAKNSLKTVGEKSVTFYYKNQTATAEFTLVNADDEIVRVTFKNTAGEKLKEVLSQKGGSVEAPEVEEIEGQTFAGWVTSSGDTVDLSNVTESVTLTARYTVDVTKYTVEFIDYNGKTVDKQTVESGSYVNPPAYTLPADVKSYSWNATFPAKVTQNMKFYMTVQKMSYNVQYGYATESNPSNITYLEKYMENVEYGGKVTNWDKARSEIAKSYTIKTDAGNNKTIYKSDTFVWIIEDASVTVTVYNDKDTKSVKTEATRYVEGSTYTFPTGAQAEEGKTFTGWKIVGSKKSSAEYKPGTTWTVTGEYGESVKIVPQYTAVCINVTYQFLFEDITVAGGTNYIYNTYDSTTYILDATHNRMKYADIQSELAKVKASGSKVSDGTTAGNEAKNRLKNYEISYYKYNGKTYTVGQEIVLSVSDAVIEVALQNTEDGTVGIEYEKKLLFLSTPAIGAEFGPVTWTYDGDAVVAPCVVDTDSFDIAKLVYTSELTGAASGAPTYKAIASDKIAVGTDIPSSGYYIYNEGVYTLASGTFENEVTYYLFCVPAGYRLAEVTTGETIPKDVYYNYVPSEGFKLTDHGKFQANTQYYEFFYTEGSYADGERYTYVYEAIGVDGAKYKAGSNVYFPDTHTETDDETGEEKTYNVIGVADGAFDGEYVISRLPSRLTYIGDNAFEGATFACALNLDYVKVIGGCAFTDAKIPNVTTAATVLETVGSGAFKGATAVDGTALTVTLNGKYSALPSEIFAGITSELTVTAADGCTVVGNNAFDGSNLVKLNGIEKITSVGDYAFRGTALTTAALPKVTSVGVLAFADAEKLTALSLATDNTLTDATELNLSVVQGCYALTKLTVGKKTETQQAQNADAEPEVMKKYSVINTMTAPAAGKSYALQTIEFYSEVTSIADIDVFGYFTRLAAVDIDEANEGMYSDEGVVYTAVGGAYTLFYYPVDKTGNYTVTLPADATACVMEKAAFNAATVIMLDLSELGDGVTLTAHDGVCTASVLGVITADVAVAASLSVLASRVYVKGLTAEEYETEATEQSWDKTIVKSVGDCNFGYDEDHKLVYTYEDVNGNESAYIVLGYKYATEITVPVSYTVDGVTYSVTQIKAGAFENFDKLTKLTVNANLEKIEAGAFSGCTALTELNFAAWSEKAVVAKSVAVNDKATVTLASFGGTAWIGTHNIVYLGGQLIGYNDLPDRTDVTAEDMSANGFSEEIPAEFFKDSNITSVVFPKTIRVINKAAFSGCADLKTVDFANIAEIKDSAFENSGLTEAVMPKVNVLGQKAFKGCEELKKVAAAILDYLPVEVFYGCIALSEVSFPVVTRFTTDANGVSSAFNGCRELTSVALPGYTSQVIPQNAFRDCGLEIVDFASFASVTSVEKEAFALCTQLKYVRFVSAVTALGVNAFAGNATMVVEIPYNAGQGLYKATQRDDVNGYYTDGGSKVYFECFDAGVKFYYNGQMSQAVIDQTFLTDYTNKTSIYPTVNFTFATDSNVDTSNLKLGIDDSTNKVLFTESDLAAPDFSNKNYKFIAWYEDETATKKIVFPLVVKEDTTLYAKYISTLKGTLQSADVQYIYMVTEQPKIDVENSEYDGLLARMVAFYNDVTGETRELDYFYEDGAFDESKINMTVIQLDSFMSARSWTAADIIREYNLNVSFEEAVWVYYLNGNDGETNPATFPFYKKITKDDAVTVKATVTEHKFNILNASGELNIKSGRLSVTKEQVENPTVYTYDDIGDRGYALVNYSGTDGGNVVTPDTYDDGTNGTAPIIAVYAGAFGKDGLIMTEYTLPAQTKILYYGYRDNSDVKQNGTFNDNLVKLVLPKGLAYIEDGVFTGLENLKEIVFDKDADLYYASVETFRGSKWYEDAVLDAENGANNGFVVIGRIAAEYVGNTDTVFVSRLENQSGDDYLYTSTSNAAYGVDINEEEQTVKVVFRAFDGTTEEVTYTGDGALDGDSYAVTLSAAGKEDILVTMSVRDGKVVGATLLVTLTSSETATLESLRFIAAAEQTVVLPTSVIKLNDGIMENNGDIGVLEINTALRYIGARAFYNASGLATVRYTESSAKSALTDVGEDAFYGTPWYSQAGSLLLGTVYYKYNSSDYNTSVIINNTVTRIYRGAFLNATKLTNVTFENNSKLTAIGGHAFEGSALIKITLPSSVTEVGRAAFLNCLSLTDADFSSTKMTELPQNIFQGCTQLRNVRLSSSTLTLGKKSLYEATKIESVEGKGIIELDVADSSLDETRWFKAEQDKADVYLTLGTVLVKFILGSDTKNNLSKLESVPVSIPSGVKTVLKDAFKGETAITEATIPSSVGSIGESAFEGCVNLKKVTVDGNGLKEIQSRAFYGCTLLETFNFPIGLETIGAYSFFETALKTEVKDGDVLVSDEGLVIPTTVTAIGQGAFYGVKTLTAVKLNSGLTDIGDGAFNVGEDGKLYKIIWDIDAQETEKEDGTVVDSGFTVLNNTLKNKVSGNLTTVFATDADTVLRIYFSKEDYNYIKEKQKDFTLFNLAEGVDNKILFKEDGELPTVTFSDVGDVPIDEFKAEVIYAGDIKNPTKKDYTFKYWTINDTETQISYPWEIRTDGVTLVARWQANKCDAGEGFTVVGNQINSIDDATMKTLYIPDTVAEKTVTGFGKGITANTTVTGIVFSKGENFKYMQENIFSVFINLESVSVPNDAEKTDFVVKETVLTDEDGEKHTYQVIYSVDGTKLIAFIGNAEGMEFSVPNGVTEIYAKAFINSHLKTIQLPSSVTVIGDDAFNDNIESFKVASGVYITQMTQDAFHNKSSDSFWNTEATSSSSVNGYIEIFGARTVNKATNGNKIGDFYTFANVMLAYSYISGEDLVFQNKINNFDITVLAGSMFDSADNVSLNSVTLPQKLKKINANAFANCNIKTLVEDSASTRYPNLNDIADSVFENLTFYKDINASIFMVGNVLVKVADTGTAVTVPNGTVAILARAFANSQATTVTLPNGLLTINESAFYGADKLTAISVPSSVTSIGGKAFFKCTSLTTVTFAGGASNLDSLGERAFMNCVSLTSIELPESVTTIGDEAFSGCTKLNQVVFGENSSLTTIGVSAFNKCSALKSVVIPNKVTKIQDSTFNGCKALTTVTFDIKNSKLTEIGNSAFLDCEKLGSALTIVTAEDGTSTTDLVTFVLPNALTKVGDNAFQNCSGLWGIQFNYNIDSFGRNVFSGCNRLAKVNIYRNTPPSIEEDTFEIGPSAKYRLRIYINVSEANTEAYGTIMGEYINAWDGKEINESPIKYYLYERGDLPTVLMTKGTETHVTTGDVIINPVAKWADGGYTEEKPDMQGQWAYGTVSQWTDALLSKDALKDEDIAFYWSSDLSYTAAEVTGRGDIKDTTPVYSDVEGREYSIFIADYDYIELVPSK